MSCPKVRVQLKSFLWSSLIFSCACSGTVGEEGRNAKLLDAPVQLLGKKLKGSFTGLKDFGCHYHRS